ncbi:hypothetical protein CPJ18_02015 [Agrobacterium rosae]|uniref:Uncharacterized protein n=1 Tax=Agrobacterium rosae TaxID=1972867 RepID=A0AAE5VRS5_9HYPH|nr:hypothetical protein [Agrobacterium rosae]POO54480.1 hypothetical protein CPJ18_02015 [Agrobacterium rosae]
MLVQNWRQVLKRAWSVRLMIIAAILSGLEVALPLIDGVVEIPPGVFAALSGLTVAGAFTARLLVQKGVSSADKQNHVE